MKTKYLFRLSRMMILSIVIAVLLTASLGGAHNLPGLGASSAFAQTQGNTYYVSPTGSDSNPGTQAQPWKTIGKANSTAASGDKIIVKAGTYTQQVVIKKSDLTFVADGKVITKSIEVEGNNNIVRGFTITDPSANAGIRTTGNNNLIENNEIYSTMQDGIWFFGSYNVFRGNYIHDIWSQQGANEPYDEHVDCFQTWDWNWNTENVLFENNICNHTRTSGSNQIVMLSGNRAKNLTFRGNRLIMSDAGYSPIALYGGSGFVIENNYICNTTNRGSSAIYVSGASSVSANSNTYTGYSSLGASGSGNVSGPLPCVVFPNSSPPTQIATNVPPTATVMPTSAGPSSSPLPGLSWEAEQGEITAPFVVGNGSVSQTILTDNPANGGRALYRFTIQEAGDYIVKAIVNATDAGSNSFFVGMDTEPTTTMIWDVVLTNGFEERTVSWRDGTAPEANAANVKVFSLIPGEHTLIIRGREIGAQLDKVEVARAVTPPAPTITATLPPPATQVPSETASPIPPTVTAPPPTQPGNSPSPLPGLFWEAEQGEITAPFIVVNGIVSQSILTDNPANGGRALYRFTIQEAGNYIVKAVVNAPDAGRNSFFVGMDSEPDTSMIWDVVLTNGFEERTVSWREGAAPEANAANTRIFSLAPGEHTLIIRGREISTQLDKVEVARAGAAPVPTTTVVPLPTETQLPTLPTETASPIPPTMTAPPPTQPGNSPLPLSGLFWEAEQGEITAPFVVVNGVVSQNILTDNPANAGRALYRFTVQEPGDYVVKAIVNAADTGRNSFSVGMDTEPDAYMTWDIVLTNGFEERTVSWREGAAPEANAANTKVFSLAPGEHILIIRGRELGTLLDKVEVAKVQAVPTTIPPTPIETTAQLPTETPVFPPTSTPEPPTAIPTDTPVPPTATVTETPVPPSPTPTATIEVAPTQAPSNPSASETVYDDRDSAFVYSSGWQNVNKRQAFNGSLKETTKNGSSVTLNFTGQYFSILYRSGREYRTMDVYIDGALVGSINENDWKQAFQQRWDYPGQLPFGQHTLKLVFVTTDNRNRTIGSLDAVIVR